MQSDYHTDEQQRKALATLSAQMARAGYTLQQLADGTFLAGRWGYTTKPLPDLDAARQFAQRATGGVA